MRPILKTRKPIDRLTAEDLEVFPIWEFASDEEGVEGQDETWVRPVKFARVPPEAFSLSVAADFETASGKRLPGIVGVTTSGGVEMGHGAVIFRRKYQFVPASDYDLAPRARKALAAAMKTPVTKIFPLRFILRVLIRGESERRRGVFP